jgi:NitT/TauT family transport system substrate-binding protein
MSFIARSVVMLAMMLAFPVKSAEPIQIRLGLIKFGSASWEIDSLRRHGFDRADNITVTTLDLANPSAVEVALQAGSVDAIVTDWLWVARQRHAGQKLTFVPHNAMLGDIMVAATAPLHNLADLKGKHIGVVGGPFDKSWLLLRAYSRRAVGWDIADQADIVYGAPPLLSQELESGRIDAVVTFWPFAARLKVKGYRSLISMSEVTGRLGLTAPVPMLGFAVSESWIAMHPDGMARFLDMIGKADDVMATSDEEWRRLRPLTGAENDNVLAALRDYFRSGIVTHWTSDLAPQSTRLYTLLVESRGTNLTGGAQSIPAGTFWSSPQP